MNDSAGEVSALARLTTDAATAKRLSDALTEAYDADDLAVVAFAEPGGAWIVEIYFAQAPDQQALRALIAGLADDEAGRQLEFASVVARDWVAASLAGLPPVEAERFFVHGAHDRGRVPCNRIGIEIEAALAFGTGHHGTTRGCLLALDRLLKRRRPCHTLDVGTGSGVLAIASARALHRRAIAGDIDATSVAAARQNARHNRAATYVTIVRANGVRHPLIRRSAPYDLVFANILVAPLKRLARPIGAIAAPDARVILSGLLAAEVNAAVAAWRAAGFVLERRRILDGWATLVMARPQVRG
jgi:ribosomal protein L11 methyltransferase